MQKYLIKCIFLYILHNINKIENLPFNAAILQTIAALWQHPNAFKGAGSPRPGS